MSSESQGEAVHRVSKFISLLIYPGTQVPTDPTQGQETKILPLPCLPPTKVEPAAGPVQPLQAMTFMSRTSLQL